MREVQLREAKATLSSLVDEVVRGQTAVITRHGRREAVLIGIKEWERLSQVPSFGHLLATAPLADVELPERDPTGLRPLDF